MRPKNYKKPTVIIRIGEDEAYPVYSYKVENKPSKYTVVIPRELHKKFKRIERQYDEMQKQLAELMYP